MKHKKGVVIITVMMLVAVVTILLGAYGLLVYYRNQMVDASYSDSVQAYYLAITGANYIRQHKYDDWVGGYIKPYPQLTSKKISFLSNNDIEITRELINADEAVNGINANITSTGNINGISQKVVCQSGEENFTLNICHGLYQLVFTESTSPNEYYEYFLPIIKWEIKKD